MMEHLKSRLQNAVRLDATNEYTAKIVNEVYGPEKTGYTFKG